MFGTRILSALLLVASVAANIYPTRPIANTIFSAGRSSSVTWINDRSHPSVQDMGPISIELYVAGDTHVATLSKNVQPTSRSNKVWISPTWGHNGSDYHIRFICDDPPLTVYTADFTITMMSDMTPYTGLEAPRADEGSTSVSIALPSISTSPSASPSSSTTTGASATTMQNPYADKKKTGAGGGNLWRRTSVDLERAKFRLVFILWPVLIGITMAL
ncbi:predicted protein [Sparassis crispa]|uniref:Ser-Thr-rich glycosyl-phosphatidyl-inositol-anchored membrane family-domain-containing protein n=1 Tax=Sparassis crispa TaxID=139825 RepID=A0A401GR33_9APHY|nr:predicted protein [Sparassis crispa]GBE84629.1 predicted protein [Sparassis crispa]